MSKYTELTLCNRKKWDLIRIIKEQDDIIDKIEEVVQELYLKEKIPYQSRIILLDTIGRIKKNGKNKM